MPTPFLNRCPTTGQTVQGWSAEEVINDDGVDDTYQSFACVACTRVHLVNLKTGKVLGEERGLDRPGCERRGGPALASQISLSTDAV